MPSPFTCSPVICEWLWKKTQIEKKKKKSCTCWTVLLLKFSGGYEPCGMPVSILDYEDSWPFNTTLCFLSFKKSVRVLKRLPDTLFCFNLKIRLICHTLSEAFDISKNIDRTSWLSSKDSYIWCVIDRSWLVQESPGLKPDWFYGIRLFSVKNLNILSYNNLSNILLDTGSKEMGR